MSEKIELLAPARTADIGIEAINCGADAVYIGASEFGARSAAKNDVSEIKRLVDYAHVFGVKVYVTLNTILYDEELDDARNLAQSLSDIGVDALIIQDFAYLRMGLDIPLHASTQMDNRTADKVCMLEELGFEQVVLARELGLGDIRKIHDKCPDVTLEAFVHGALCVSYSGKCYASHYCFGRSANRGECAQFCRLAFDLEDTDGNKKVRGKHLLSLKDMNRSQYVEQMIDAGIRSFKIEGRLKDVAYVKNVTASYRRVIDEIISKRHGEFERSSLGRCEVQFEPDLTKTFNRGYTDYFLLSKRGDVSSPNTPKSVGEPVGAVWEVGRNYITMHSGSEFHNGDGLCFFDDNDALCGCRVNRVDGRKLFLLPFPKALKPGKELFRNKDMQFDATLQKRSPSRSYELDMNISDVDDGYRVMARVDGVKDTICVGMTFPLEKEEARSSQISHIKRELQKSARPFFKVTSVEVGFDKEYFIPASTLSRWRRDVHDRLLAELLRRNESCRKSLRAPSSMPQFAVGVGDVDYSLNVSNKLSKDIYEQCLGVEVNEPAFECFGKDESKHDCVLMTCKYCLRYALGQCLKNKNKTSSEVAVARILPRALQLSLPDGRKFPLEFDCSKCEMIVKSR